MTLTFQSKLMSHMKKKIFCYCSRNMFVSGFEELTCGGGWSLGVWLRRLKNRRIRAYCCGPVSFALCSSRGLYFWPVISQMHCFGLEECKFFSPVIILTKSRPCWCWSLCLWILRFFVVRIIKYFCPKFIKVNTLSNESPCYRSEHTFPANAPNPEHCATL